MLTDCISSFIFPLVNYLYPSFARFSLVCVCYIEDMYLFGTYNIMLFASMSSVSYFFFSFFFLFLFYFIKLTKSIYHLFQSSGLGIIPNKFLSTQLYIDILVNFLLVIL